ncbi:GroES-like protein [Polyplosphaeria fusca]|uniref:D-xylulose reductase n=1 Tax=Polyplosphaeria fusca TaxID=682080 RepID=A0A9P4V1M3_9PLEO|nr:GroES-like protein [Polyplosphaeria fusca]
MTSPTSQMTNPSAVLYAAGDLRFEDRPAPSLQDPYDVLVKINFVGVCGSDVHFWTHGHINNKRPPPTGLIMGHEASGTILATGSCVTRVAPGDAVAIEPGVPCRRCKSCKDGVYNLCPKMRFCASPPDAHGALTGVYVTAEDFVYKMPEAVGLQEAVLVEPLSVGVHAVRLAGVGPGECVVVMGCGTIGLMCAAVARRFGAGRVVLVDVVEGKLGFARGWIECETFRPEAGRGPEENAERLLEQLGIEGPLGLVGVDTVIEASGAASSIQTAINVLRPGGKYVQTGLGKDKIEFPIVTMSEKELLMRGCFRYSSGDYELAVSFIAKRLIDVKALITSVSPFEETAKAWDLTKNGQGIKNLIRVARLDTRSVL